MKNFNAAAAICLCLFASLFLFSCGNSADMPSETTGYGYDTEPHAESQSEIAPVSQPAAEAGTEPQTEPETAPAELGRIERIVASLTLEEKIGQMFIIRCSTDSAESDVAGYHLGGLVMFAENFEDRNPQQVADAIASYQAAAKIPLIVAVDEEGGSVVRVSRYRQYRSQPFKAPQELYREGGLKKLLSDVDEKTNLLRSLGINCNLAPVCDVSTDPESYIYPRTLGLNGQKTAEIISAVTLRYVELGMGCVLKHFPGYGGNTDTHEGISVDTRDFSSFEQSDLLPFIAGIQAGAGAVMVSHNIVTCIDPDYPASLSRKVCELLRETLGFDGVIMTDSLDMGAILKFAEQRGENPAVLAVLAGCDMICTRYVENDFGEVKAAIEAGTIPISRVDEAVERVLRWKEALGILK